jgi:hypothetical protein
MDIGERARKIEVLDGRILAGERRLAKMQEHQDRRRAQRSELIKDLFLHAAEQTGLLDRTPVDMIKALNTAAALPAANSGDVDTDVTAPKPTPSVLISGSDDRLPVEVKISRNASFDKRALMASIGMKWNGKRGLWHGPVDRRRLPELRAVFGEALHETIHLDDTSTHSPEEGAGETGQNTTASAPVADVTELPHSPAMSQDTGDVDAALPTSSPGAPPSHAEARKPLVAGMPAFTGFRMPRT